LKYRDYLFDCATGDGKSVVAYGAIVADTYDLPDNINKALVAVPYDNLAREKYHELAI
jgi:replicative superfamily II helicase